MSYGKLKFSQLFSFTLPNLALGILIIPVVAILPNVYAQKTSISLGAIGAVLAGTRIFDAISDQLIGFYSDRTRSRLGARLPWMLAGTPLLMFSAFFLYSPPMDADIWYFGTWSFLFYLSYTLLAIPYLAWASELTTDYNERSKVFAWYSASSQIGGLLFFAAPLILYSMGLVKNTEFGTEQVKYVGLFAVFILPILVAYAAFTAPRTKVVSDKTTNLKELLLSMKRNKPLRLFLAIYVIAVIAYGMFAATLILFLDSHYGLGDKIPYILVVISIVSIISIYPWSKILYRFGKHKPWALSWIASSLILPLLLLVSPDNEQVLFWVLLILSAHAFAESASNFAPSSVLADIVDYEILLTGVDRAGSFYALHGFIIKSAVALGAGLGFMMLEWFSYNVKEPELNSALAEFGILFTVIIVPSVVKFFNAYMVWVFPIDARRQAIIRKRIESLAVRRARETNSA